MNEADGSGRLPSRADGERSPTARSLGLASAALLALNAAVFAQVVGFDFVTWDDPVLVTANPYIRDGLTLDGVVWVLTNSHAGNWHPLTGLSHMLDCELFGLDPRGHHLSSALLHAANSVLLLLALHALTGSPMRSAGVAALFAIHPLHVESVAWVSERKDVLSGTFTMLSLWAYARYAQYGGGWRYMRVAGFFALGLLSKPMLVTLPLVFVLLDYWPLERDRSREPRALVKSLFMEKIPLLCLSLVVSVITIATQGDWGTMRAGESIEIPSRLANAVVSYVLYLGKTAWPDALAFMYPHPNLPGGNPWTSWQTAGAATLLVAITALCLRSRPRYLTVGWAWFGIMLLPVIGVVQVGIQGMADRYTYLPLIGIFLIVVWGFSDMAARAASRWPGWRGVAIAIAVLATAGLVARSFLQARTWRDSRTLYEHALRTTSGTPMLHNNLANVLREEGDLPSALRHYRLALGIDPRYLRPRLNLARALASSGHPDEAIQHGQLALEVDPESADAELVLARAQAQLGNWPRSESHYRRVLSLEPESLAARFGLGNALRSQRRLDQAEQAYLQLLEAHPDHVGGHVNLGLTLLAQDRFAEAVAHLQRASQIAPDNAGIQRRLQHARRAARASR